MSDRSADVYAITDTRNDAISDGLRSLTVQSSVFCTSELHSPWGFSIERPTIAKFHLVPSGEYGTEAALAKASKRERGETLGAHRAAARGAPEINLVASAA